MSNTSGFYKMDGSLIYAPHAVLGPEYELLIEEKDTYTYPTYGWYWFNDEETAKMFFNIEDENV